MIQFKKIYILFFIAWIILGCNDEKAQMTDETIENKSAVPVEVEILKKKAVDQKIPLAGVIQPLHAINLVAETNGIVKQLSKNLGARVSRTDTLAIIDDRVPLSQFRQAKAQVFSAKNNLNIARLNLESDKELFENGDISKLEYENTKLAEKTAQANWLSVLANLSLAEKSFLDTRITSPINGVISRKNIELGTMVNTGMILYRIVDLSTLKIKAGISQNAISLVHPGVPAEISISAIGNKIFPGTVKYISPQANENTGTFQCEIHVPNHNFEIKAGMTAQITLLITETEKQLVLPDYALVTKNGSQAVYKVKKNLAMLTDVSVVQTFGSQVVITEGVTQGDTVVVVGMKNLGLNTPVLIETIHK